MTGYEGTSGDFDPRALQDEQLRAIEAYADERLGWLQDVAQIVGERIDDDAGVFKKPPAERDDAPMPDWTEDQISEVRRIARRFGIGAEQDISSGLQKPLVVLEGGRVRKMLAEAEALGAEDTPTRIVVSGASFRELGEEDQQQLRVFLALPHESERHENGKLPAEVEEGIDAVVTSLKTEHDFAVWLAGTMCDKGERDEKVLPFGYQLEEGYPTTEEPTGQLVRLGINSEGIPVEVLRVDQAKPYRPKTKDIMGFMSRILGKEQPDVPVAVMTSTTYASRVVDTVRAGLADGRQFGVNMYWQGTLAKVEGRPEPPTPDTPLNHLPGELRVMHDRLAALKTEVVEKRGQ